MWSWYLEKYNSGEVTWTGRMQYENGYYATKCQTFISAYFWMNPFKNTYHVHCLTTLDERMVYKKFPILPNSHHNINIAKSIIQNVINFILHWPVQ